MTKLSSFVLALLLVVPLVAAVPKATVPASSNAIEATAKGIDKKGSLTVTDFQLQGDSKKSTLKLEEFNVFAPDAKIDVSGSLRAPPANKYFRGTTDEPGSSVLLTVRANGGMSGIVFKGNGVWMMGKGKGQGGLNSNKVDLSAANNKPFACGTDALLEKNNGTRGGGRKLLDHLHLHHHHDHDHLPWHEHPHVDPVHQRQLLQSVIDKNIQIGIAIETDNEYLAKFGGNVDSAVDYAADLVGMADVVYGREANVDVLVTYIRIHTAPDPYGTPTSSGNALDMFRAEWTTNMKNVKRSIAHMISPQSTGGGVAWLSVLCDQNYGYAYSGHIAGNMQWNENQGSNPTNGYVVWDLMVFLHEMGHNMGTHHTHEYCNVGGVAEPVDHCYASNSCGAQTGLPACSGTSPYFPSTAKGTIMSYCHQVSGGMNNIALTFGGTADLPFTCGTSPTRVADNIRAHVASRLSSNPTCFQMGSLPCGNNIVDVGEVCDGTALNGQTCQSQGFIGGGVLACSNDCKSYVTSGCSSNPVCGDKVKNGDEECDGTDFGTDSCSARSFAYGSLKCTADCKVDASECTNTAPPTCGDGTKNQATEECDGTDLDGKSCTSLLFEGGTLSCSSSCKFVTTGCFKCGNGVIETGEECDGTNLGGQTCVSKGFLGGTLSCNACKFDTSKCCSTLSNMVVRNGNTWSTSGASIRSNYRVTNAQCELDCKNNGNCKSWSYDIRNARCTTYTTGDRAYSVNTRYNIGAKTCP